MPQVNGDGPANYLIVGSGQRKGRARRVAAYKFGDTKTEPEKPSRRIMVEHVAPNTPGKGFLV